MSQLREIKEDTDRLKNIIQNLDEKDSSIDLWLSYIVPRLKDLDEDMERIKGETDRITFKTTLELIERLERLKEYPLRFHMPI